MPRLPFNPIKLTVPYAVWLYHRFCLSFRDSEDRLRNAESSFPTRPFGSGARSSDSSTLATSDVEELLAKRGIIVSYETIRQWCRKFGPEYARDLQRRHGRKGDIWHLDELFVNIQGKRHYLWRAVDQDGDAIDILVQKHRSAHAARRFFRKLLKGQGSAQWLRKDYDVPTHKVG